MNSNSVYRCLAILLFGSMLLPMLMVVASPTVSAFTGSGSGTSADPYIITTVDQLQEMNDNLTASYALGNDIDASATLTWNDNGDGGYYGFLPIGTSDGPCTDNFSTNAFLGSFDGKGYVITNLYINRPSTWYIGLFGWVGNFGVDAVVENVGLENENIKGDVWVGGLVGWNNFGGTVTNCYSTGTVSGTDVIGGLVGVNWGGNVDNCHSTCDVSGNQYVGGLVGVNDENLSNSYATGSVSGGDKYDFGGLVGQNLGTISNCYSTGAVSGHSHVGGLVGYNYGLSPIAIGIISNSYSTGSVSGDNYVGGLVGYKYYGTVSNSYSIGVVSGSTKVGGLIGYAHGGTVSNSFWDNETSGQATSSGGTWKTTENMKNVRTYTDNTWSENLTTPWDFAGNPYYDENDNDIWDIHPSVNNGYPFLTSLLSIPLPTKPVLVSPENTIHTNDNTPTLEWTVGLYADNHRVLVDNDSDFSTPNENRIVVDNTYTIADENSLAYGTYYWKVVAINTAGENESDVWWFRVDTLAPAAWSLIESWTGTVSAPAQWNLIDTWTGTVSAPAAWQLVETWTGTVTTTAAWQLIESWTGTVNAPAALAAWSLVESWTGTITAPTVPPPPADFSISVHPTSGEVVQGGSTTTTITAAPSGGYSYTVSLTASGQPSGVVITILPNSGTPSFTSTMTINVSRSAPAGTYTITITGTGADGKVRSTIYTLKITPAPPTIPVSSVNAISPYWQTSVPFVITATASDLDGHVTNVALWYRYSTDNSSWENWALFGVDSSEPWSWSFAASRGDGYYEFYSIARDNDNNEELAKFQAEARCGVDRAAPPAPQLISPADGTKTGDTTPTFDWSDVADLSGVTYEFKIEAYGSLVMIKTCISSSYAIETDEALPESAYHWYVRAVDGAGNVSDWSEARSFTIELVPPITVKLGTISANVPQVADFTLYNVFVIKVTITTLRDVHDVEVSIKESIGKPAWVSEPSGIMYTVYATITTNIAPSDISSAIVLFQLPKLWITQNGVDDGTIKLLKTGSDWHTLPTTRIEADENYAYFEAATSGFSLFVATGEKASPLPPSSGLPLLPLVILSIIAVGIGGLIAYRLMRPSRYFTILRRLERAVVRPRKRQIGELVRPPARVHRRVSRADQVAFRRLERIIRKRERRIRELEVEPPVRVRKRAIAANQVAFRRLERIMRERKKKWARETRKKSVKRKVKQKKSTNGRKKSRPKP